MALLPDGVESELELSFVRSSGPGGQNVNKVNSKCVLRWNLQETELLDLGVKLRLMALARNQITKDGILVMTSDRFRDQRRNTDDCLAKLGALLGTAAAPQVKRVKTKPTRSSKRRREAGKKANSDKKAQRRKDWD